MAYVTSSSGLLTFLDTNVVQNLHTFGEFIYRGNFSPQEEEKLSKPRNLAGNPDSPQAVIFLASITDVMMGSRNVLHTLSRRIRL